MFSTVKWVVAESSEVLRELLFFFFGCYIPVYVQYLHHLWFEIQKCCTTRIMSLDIHFDLLSINLVPLCPLYNHALA